eukprot:1371222-Rhodomonas_salina.1
MDAHGLAPGALVSFLMGHVATCYEARRSDYAAGPHSHSCPVCPPPTRTCVTRRFNLSLPPSYITASPRPRFSSASPRSIQPPQLSPATHGAAPTAAPGTSGAAPAIAFCWEGLTTGWAHRAPDDDSVEVAGPAGGTEAGRGLRPAGVGVSGDGPVWYGGNDGNLRFRLRESRREAADVPVIPVNPVPWGGGDVCDAASTTTNGGRESILVGAGLGFRGTCTVSS